MEIGKANGNDIFRKAYRQLTEQEQKQLDDVKDAAAVLHDAINRNSPSRPQSLAITKLEEAVMWAVKAITA